LIDDADLLRTCGATTYGVVGKLDNTLSKGSYIDYQTYDSGYNANTASTSSLSQPHVSSADCLTYLQQVWNVSTTIFLIAIISGRFPESERYSGRGTMRSLADWLSAHYFISESTDVACVKEFETGFNSFTLNT